ncbi:MAG: histidine phosphatase family protein [Actinomycetota bacterium]|nr:histidine phosphatase family protein [Actinomycetota bacterium]
MTLLVLIRHATTASTGKRLGGRTQASLDEAGRAQAEAAAQRLADVPLKAVYASPLPRTMETAEAVAAPHRLVVRPDESLLEVDYGRWTDRPLTPLTRTKTWPVIQARPSLVAFPDGETIRGAQLRAVDGLQRIVARHPRSVVAAVSHADVIKAVVAAYLSLALDSFQRLHVDPASATVLALSADGGQPALLRFNDDGPLRLAAHSAPTPKASSRKTAPSRTAPSRTARRG